MAATQKWYLKNTNVDTEYDYGANHGDHDLATSYGTSTTHYSDVSKETYWAVVRSYQIQGTGKYALSGEKYLCSISLNTVTNADIRFKIWILDSSGTIPLQFCPFRDFIFFLVFN